MEVTNNSQHFTIPLVVGRRIAQMVFYEVEPLKASVIDYVGEGGKYQLSQEIEEVKKSWNPHMMIPQMHKDWEVPLQCRFLPIMVVIKRRAGRHRYWRRLFFYAPLTANPSFASMDKGSFIIHGEIRCPKETMKIRRASFISFLRGFWL